MHVSGLLNMLVVSAFGYLLHRATIGVQDRDKRWFQDGSQKRSRCLFMNSHFLAKLCQEPGGYDYSKVRRWTADRKRKALAIDYYGGIEDLDKMVLPVHLGNHWVRSCLPVLCSFHQL